MNVSENGGCQSVPRQGDQDLVGALPPEQIVLRTPTAQSWKDQSQVVFANELFRGSRRAAQTNQ